MAADRPLPISAQRIRLDAAYYSHFEAQRLGPIILSVKRRQWMKEHAETES